MKSKAVRKPFKISVSVWGRCLTSFDGYPGWRLPGALQDSGFELVPLGDRSAEGYLALEHSNKNLIQASRQIPRSNRVLIALEPEAVTPAQHSQPVRNKYGLTLVQSPLQRKSSDDLLIRMGYLPPKADLLKLMDKHARPTDRRAKRIAVINENKFSFVRRNNYGTRRRLMREIAGLGTHVVLAGRGWDGSVWWRVNRQIRAFAHCILSGSIPRFKNFSVRSMAKFSNVSLVGRVESELDFISQSRFNLVIENDPDYLSEKLFNAVMGGSVPIYIGPALSLFDIPNNVAIQVPPDVSGITLLKILQEKSDIQLDEIVSNGRRWLTSQSVMVDWLHDSSFDRIANQLDEYFNGIRGRQNLTSC